MKTIETGDIGYFYRNRIDIDKASGPKDIQSLYMVLLPDDRKRGRLFVIGKKKMPLITQGRTSSEAREWAMTVAVGSPRKIADALAPIKYDTKTRGTRIQDEAIALAEGRYKIVKDDYSSHLLQRIDTPKSLGRAQKALRLKKTADYVLSVRSPKIDVPGFPDEKPDYPDTLLKRFADERWLPVDDRRLINYENAQCLLLGAKTSLSESAPGIDGHSQLLEKLQISGKSWPVEPLRSGDYGKPQGKVQSRSSSGNRSKGGERGGKTALQKPSSAGIAKALKGCEFPCKKDRLTKVAQGNRATKPILEVLSEFPARQYHSMSDVQKALGEVR